MGLSLSNYLLATCCNDHEAWADYSGNKRNEVRLVIEQALESGAKFNETMKFAALNKWIAQTPSMRNIFLSILKACGPQGHCFQVPCLEYACEEFKNDKEIVLELLKVSSDEYAYLNDNLQNDNDVLHIMNNHL